MSDLTPAAGTWRREMTPNRASPVLLVEDNDGDADLIMDLLSEVKSGARHHVVRATRLSEAVSVLQDMPVEVVLLDLRLPDGAGVECVAAVREQASDVPIVVLTGLEDDAIAKSCITAGAQDYLSKQEVRAASLARAIDYAVVRAQEAVARMRSQQLLLRSAELERENQRILEASRLKSQFLANMSHELRTPLNAIIGFSELIQDGKVPAESERFPVFVGHILSSARHLLQLINDILDLARIEAGRLDLSTEETDLRPLAHEVVEVVNGSFAGKSLEVDLSIDSALGTVWTDPRRLRQVLYNYLSNAWKFTPEGGRITVRILSRLGGRFRLEVEDSGVGIAPGDLAMLFTEFTQLRSDAGKRYSGTGLGLALTKRIVEAQGGTVGASSVLGQGSVFYAELPATAGEGASA